MRDLLSETIERARRESESSTIAAERSYERGEHNRGHDLSNSSPDEKRRLFSDAKYGSIGGDWQSFALRNDVEIGVFLFFYEARDMPPTSAELAIMWPGCEPTPASPKPPPDRRYVDRGNLRNADDGYGDFDAGRF